MKGTVAQAESRTAITGYLATVTAGQSGDQERAAAWLEARKVEIGHSGLRSALKMRLTRFGAQPAGEPPDIGWIRQSLDFDAPKLDLDLALVVFPPSDNPDSLIRVMRDTKRVIRIYRGYDRALLAILLFDGARERLNLRTMLEDRAPSLTWVDVREVDDQPAASTWLSLAERCAAQEGLLRT